MKIVNVIVGFLPLVLFSVLSTMVGAGWAAVVALAVAVVVIATTAQGGVKIVPVAQAVILLAMAVLAFTGGPAVDHELAKYGPALHGLLLGLFMLATAPTMPFTAQYARTTVPSEVWHSARFLEVNRDISVAWGLVLLFHGVCHFAAAEIPVTGWHLAVRLAVAWVLPLAAVWQATVYTQRTAGAARHEAQERHPHEAGAVAS